ncbi:MAG: hypothetical protein Phyf2KO_21560 [Phycisphaerales bacterium]
MPQELLDDPRFGVFPTERIDAVLGLPLVIMVEIVGGYLPEDVGEVVLDDGREIETRLMWIGVRYGDAAGSWLEPAGEWSARTVEEVASGLVPDDEVGAWAVMIDPPIDAVGQGIWIAGRRHSVNWLPDPSVVASRVSSRAWLSPIPPSMRESVRLRFLVEPMRENPFIRWRYKLMVGELSPSIEQRVVELDGSVRRPVGDVEWASGHLRSETLETLARQRESRWAIGLARLDQADDELAERVRQRLCAIVDFGAGEIAPFWPLERDGINRLLSDLLDQRLQPRERARRARLWLSDQRESHAWVVSDAPRSDPVTGKHLATVAVVNAAYEPRLASVASRFEAEASDLSSLGQLRARAYEVITDPSGGEIPAVVARVGSEERVLSVPGVNLRASPPGLRIDRFFGDWSLLALQSSAVPVAPGGDENRCGALLYREPAGRWMLYVECAAPENEHTDQRVRVTLGPEAQAGSVVIVLSPDQEPSVEFEENQPPMAPLVPDVEVSSFPGGWYARLVIPDRVIENRGTLLRLGIEHFDALDRRSAWPRPMLPWQGSCGRAAIDLTQWGGVGR